jgi:hypothetical protein
VDTKTAWRPDLDPPWSDIFSKQYWNLLVVGLGYDLAADHHGNRFDPIDKQRKEQGGTMSEQNTGDDSTRSESATPVAVEPKSSNGRWAHKQLGGLFLILIGAIFLLANLGFLWWWNWGTMWPTILIGMGLFILARNVNLRIGT